MVIGEMKGIRTGADVGAKGEKFGEIQQQKQQQQQDGTEEEDEGFDDDDNLEVAAASFVCLQCSAVFVGRALLAAHLPSCRASVLYFPIPESSESQFLLSHEALDQQNNAYAFQNTSNQENINALTLTPANTPVSVHTTLHPRATFACQHPGCPSVFVRIEHLKRHEDVHALDRRFKCPVEGCHKSFNQQGHLKYHMTTHSKQRDKSFVCSVCSKSLCTKQALKGHLHKVHGVVDETTAIIPRQERRGKKYNTLRKQQLAQQQQLLQSINAHNALDALAAAASTNTESLVARNRNSSSNSSSGGSSNGNSNTNSYDGGDDGDGVDSKIFHTVSPKAKKPDTFSQLMGRLWRTRTVNSNITSGITPLSSVSDAVSTGQTDARTTGKEFDNGVFLTGKITVMDPEGLGDAAADAGTEAGAGVGVGGTVRTGTGTGVADAMATVLADVEAELRVTSVFRLVRGVVNGVVRRGTSIMKKEGAGAGAGAGVDAGASAGASAGDEANEDEPTATHALRIVSVNDVYKLDLLAHLAAAVDRARASTPPPHTVPLVVVLPGDFLSPSLLSSLDRGLAMVDVLNQCGVDYVCFGNHEDDVDFASLNDRIEQSNFVWINSNIPKLKVRESIRHKVPDHVKLSIPSIGNTDLPPKTVALLGLCTDDAHLYKPFHFGGADILPVNPTAIKFAESLKPSVDIIIPLTHQDISADRELANTDLFPIIIGGHEHEPFLEYSRSHRSQIIKTGADASQYSIIDITWNSLSQSPSISIALKNTVDVPPSPQVLESVQKHMLAITLLRQSVLCTIPPNTTLSSKHVRRQPASLPTFLSSMVRDATKSDCCIINAGTFRGNKKYTTPPDSAGTFTYSDLEAEMPYQSEIAQYQFPGRIIDEIIRFSRAPALQNPPVEKGGYMQTCDAIEWDRETNRVTKIGGEPLDRDKLYNVAISYQSVAGLDNILPLLDYLGERRGNGKKIEKREEEELGVDSQDDKDTSVDNATGIPGVIATTETTDDSANIKPIDDNYQDDKKLAAEQDHDYLGAKEIIVSHFCFSIWHSILKIESFDELDRSHSGHLTRADIFAACARHFKGDVALSRAVCDNLFSMADPDGDGVISRAEFLKLKFEALAEIKFSRDHDVGELTAQISDIAVPVTVSTELPVAASESTATTTTTALTGTTTPTITAGVAEIKKETAAAVATAVAVVATEDIDDELRKTQEELKAIVRGGELKGGKETVKELEVIANLIDEEEQKSQDTTSGSAAKIDSLAVEQSEDMKEILERDEYIVRTKVSLLPSVGNDDDGGE
ncbi:hypothetical protein HK100_000155 [Physocladia obscura]|uniref:Calmodulin n=1 Tax=Physocladia obscura TaxID=109957 RepID=A0AAD5SYS3_9FUNG|nr:hypothetical protein HK100_000155 [Physocladia obscura]